METDFVNLNSQSHWKPKLSHFATSWCRAGRHLLWSTPQAEVRQQRNIEQQTTCPFLQKEVVGTPDIERTKSASLVGNYQEKYETSTLGKPLLHSSEPNKEDPALISKKERKMWRKPIQRELKLREIWRVYRCPLQAWREVETPQAER